MPAEKRLPSHPSLSVDCANHTVLFPEQLSLGDHLILHALGAAWREESTPAKRRLVREAR
jgi:hypothetical protein